MREASTLLMLAFEFPPFSGVGAQRSVKLAQYLPDYGVKPIVITTDAGSLAEWYGSPGDASSLGEVPATLDIHRVPAPRPPTNSHLARRLNAFFSLGEPIGQSWRAALTPVVDALVRDAKPDAIYVSIPPFSVSPVALELAKRSGLPLIVDFRDHWSQWCHNARPTRAHYLMVLNREREVVMGADAVVGVTAQLVRDLQRAHPAADSGKFSVVHNGFDGEVRAQLAPARAGSASEPFVIGYAGSFYYSPEMRASVMEPWWKKPIRHWPQYSPRREDWLYRSPYFFLRALAALIARRPEIRSRVRVRFAGDRPDWLQPQVDHFGLGDVVTQIGRLSHQDSLAFQASCDALLVTSMKVPGGRDYCIAGKTFEYLTTGKPILGIVTDGEQRDFLLASGAAVVADADDVDAAARAIEQLVDGGTAPPPNRNALAGYHRRETARQMAAIVHRLDRRHVA
jgi:glycosyltransferase involved in cell wall biosynthesis